MQVNYDGNEAAEECQSEERLVLQFCSLCLLLLFLQV